MLMVMSESPSSVPTPRESTLLVDTLQSSIVTASQILTWINRNPVLSRVRDLTLWGWQHSNDPELKPFQQHKDELCIHDGCVLWGTRVMVPPAGRAKV